MRKQLLFWKLRKWVKVPNLDYLRVLYSLLKFFSVTKYVNIFTTSLCEHKIICSWKSFHLLNFSNYKSILTFHSNCSEIHVEFSCLNQWTECNWKSLYVILYISLSSASKCWLTDSINVIQERNWKGKFVSSWYEFILIRHKTHRIIQGAIQKFLDWCLFVGLCDNAGNLVAMKNISLI